MRTGKKWANARKLVSLEKCSGGDSVYVVMVLIDHVIILEKRITRLEEKFDSLKKGTELEGEDEEE